MRILNDFEKMSARDQGLLLVNEYITNYTDSLAEDPDNVFRQEYCNSRINLAREMLEIAAGNNYVISKSPYSESFYAHPEDDKVDWGYKPDGSYRLSDHWNWFSYNRIHCPTIEGQGSDAIQIRQFKNGAYELIQDAA